MSKNLIIPIFIPHLGCPHTCVFCNQKKIAGNYSRPTSEQVKNTVEKYLETFKNREGSWVELAFYGGSFTAIEKELQEELLEIALYLKQGKQIDGIRISTRPDYMDSEVIARLIKFQVDTVELGVQSLDPVVLRKSERGHTTLDVEEAVKNLKAAEKKIGIQLMPGLPWDNPEKVLMTTKKVIQLKPDFVRIYPTVVIKETKLAKLYETGHYSPWSLEEAVEVSTLMYILFARASIPVIRLGLQATENLQEGRDLLAGPYHSAFGELVKSRIFRKQIEYLLSNFFQSFPSYLKVYCNSREISQIKGQNLENIRFFQENHHVLLEISSQPDLPPGFLAWENFKNNSWSFLSRREFLDRYRISG